MYALGAAVAAYMGVPINWIVYAAGQVIVTVTQLMVHYSNDYFDIEADRANPTPTDWSGGSRVLPNGYLSPRVAYVTAVCLALIAITGSVLLTITAHPGPLALPMLLLGVFLSWFYSAPPLQLHSRGVGEYSATFEVAILTPLVGFYLQAGRLELLPVLAIIPLSLRQFNMLVGVAIPDADGDVVVNKRTLIVRMGRQAISRLYLVVLIAPYVLLPVLIPLGLPAVVTVAYFFTLPLVIWLGWIMLRGEWTTPPGRARIAFLGIVLLLSTSGLELLIFVVLALSRV